MLKNLCIRPLATSRPGQALPTLSQSHHTPHAIPGGKYVLTYEYGGGPGVSGYGFPVYYRISSSPLTLASATAYELAVGSDKPQGSPYVVWTSTGTQTKLSLSVLELPRSFSATLLSEIRINGTRLAQRSRQHIQGIYVS